MYLGSSRSQDAGLFVVALDDVQTEIDGFSPTADNNCSYTWSQSNLSKGYHNLTISYVGPSPQSQTQSGSFELNNFQYVSKNFYADCIPGLTGFAGLWVKILPLPFKVVACQYIEESALLRSRCSSLDCFKLAFFWHRTRIFFL